MVIPRSASTSCCRALPASGTYWCVCSCFGDITICCTLEHLAGLSAAQFQLARFVLLTARSRLSVASVTPACDGALFQAALKRRIQVVQPFSLAALFYGRMGMHCAIYVVFCCMQCSGFWINVHEGDSSYRISMDMPLLLEGIQCAVGAASAIL
jgi:hypothetical protein